MNYFEKFQGKPSLWGIIAYSLIFASLLVYIAYHITNEFSESLFQEKFTPFLIIALLSIFPISRATYIYIKSKKEGKPFEAYKGLGWIAQGLSWGYLMLLVLSASNILFDGETTINTRKIYLMLPFWGIAGLLVGYTTKKSFKDKRIIESQKHNK